MSTARPFYPFTSGKGWPNAVAAESSSLESAGAAGSPMVITYAGTKAFSQTCYEGLWWGMKHCGVDVLHVVVGYTNTPAMARLGITYPAGQGVEPKVVARHALENVAKGSAFVMPQIIESFRQVAIPDRRTATEICASVVMATIDGTADGQS